MLSQLNAMARETPTATPPTPHRCPTIAPSTTSAAYALEQRTAVHLARGLGARVADPAAHAEQQADAEQPERQHDPAPGRSQHDADELGREHPQEAADRQRDEGHEREARSYALPSRAGSSWTCDMSGKRTRLTIRPNAVAGITIRLYARP